ncbi:MAG: chromosomal replication initiator protein DnaA [Spirochaetaceae bacterium]|jgi:chromosomal replication initiator protein|nr:chromosomal replication initiator protein DnaA [Spirochaetaceae bacterium]
MAEWDYEQIWKETIDYVREELGEQEFSLGFNINYIRSTEHEIVISVPTSLQRDMLKKRYLGTMENKLKTLSDKKLSIVFEIDSGQNNKEAVPSSVPENTKTTQAPGRPAKKKENYLYLRENYTFDKYVIGENNNFAANAAIAVSRNPGNAYNPLLIYGGVGLGKTHLMQAIGNYLSTNSDSKIIYITAESFTNEFIQALQENKMPAFKNKYRYTDILLIDDVHFLQNKLGTQEELFHTFNSLYNAKKQMVLTCDRPISELKNLNDRLRTRFEMGLNVDLQPPNYETRCAILKKKIEANNISIPDEVIALVSKNVSSNIRDLEAALIKLIAYSELVGKPITLEIAQQQLKDVFASFRQSNMSIDTILRIVAEQHNLTINDLKGRKRTQNIVIPRQVSMYIARQITEYSTTEIGQSIGGRDHTTVMHSCNMIEERIRSDPHMDPKIQNLIRQIKEYSAKS